MTRLESLEALLVHTTGPLPMARLARLLLSKGQGEKARGLCARALAIAPNDPELQAIAAEINSYNVPRWHFSIVRDRARNDAYDAALRRAIRPSSRVLEIGAGTGLLAMMAARAGAAKVVTCESDPAVAAMASEIIAGNGFADRVDVVAKASSDIALGVDLDWRADVLVSEVVSNDLLGEGVLPAMEQAVRRLLNADAQIIPARGIVRVALAEDREVDKERMGIVHGFDLSRFNRLRAPYCRINVGNERLLLRSEPADLFRFDFQSGGPFPEARGAVSLSASGGVVNGIAQWIRLEMDDHGSYENAPAIDAWSAWDVLFYPLMRPVEMTKGETIKVCGVHDRLSLRIWAALPEA
jgi:type III protein arginine methyltransferase